MTDCLINIFVIISVMKFLHCLEYFMFMFAGSLLHELKCIVGDFYVA